MEALAHGVVHAVPDAAIADLMDSRCQDCNPLNTSLYEFWKSLYSPRPDEEISMDDLWRIVKRGGAPLSVVSTPPGIELHLSRYSGIRYFERVERPLFTLMEWGSSVHHPLVQSLLLAKNPVTEETGGEKPNGLGHYSSSPVPPTKGLVNSKAEEHASSEGVAVCDPILGSNASVETPIRPLEGLFSRRNEVPVLSARETERGDGEKQSGQSATAAANDGQVHYARPDAAVCYVGRSSWNHGAASASSSGECPQVVIQIDDLAPAPAPAPAPPAPLWILDTGASHCSTGDPSILQGLHRADVVRVVSFNGGEMWSDSCGRAFGNVKHSGIRYFPGAAASVISVGCLAKKGCELKLNRDGFTVTKGGILVGRGRLLGDGTWSLDSLDDTLLGSPCDACPSPHAHACS